jgi:hypothetical protein
VDIKIRNGRFLGALDKIGMTIPEFSKEYGVQVNELYSIASMKSKPTYANGDWKPAVMKLAELSGIMPDNMFTPEQRGAVTQNNITIAVTRAELINTIGPARAIADTRPSDKVLEQAEIMKIVSDAIGTLNERHQVAFKGIFVENRTLEDVGSQLGVTRERVRQMSCKAQRRIMHTSKEALGRKHKNVLDGLFNAEGAA